MTPKHLATTMAHLGAISGSTMSGGSAAAPIVPTAGTAGKPYDDTLAAARKAGAEAERTRIGAILNHEAAASRGKLAAHLAFKTSMTVEEAGAMLAASAIEGAAAGSANAGFSWDEVVAEHNATIPGATKAHQGPASTGQDAVAASGQKDAGFSWDDVVAEHNASNGFTQGAAR